MIAPLPLSQILDPAVQRLRLFCRCRYGIFCFFFLLVEGLQNLLFSAALSERNFVVSILRQTKVYELITRLSDDK